MPRTENLQVEPSTDPVTIDFRFGDAGIFVGLVSWSARSVRDVQEVYEHQITPLFEQYRDSLRGNGTELPELYYRPIPFSLFGRWDFAVIALVDDTEFVRQTFRPFDPMVLGVEQTPPSGGPHQHRPFQHKVIFGPVPTGGQTLGPPLPNIRDDGIVERCFRDMFFCDHEGKNQPPLVAICQLKLNPYLTCGSGLGMMRGAIQGLKIRCHQAREQRGVRSLIIQSYAWNELTLILLGKAYEDLHELVVSAREWSVGSLSRIIESASADEHHRFQSYFDSPSVEELLLRLDGYQPSESQSLLQRCHIFVNTTTTVGYSYDIEDPLLRASSPRPAPGRSATAAPEEPPTPDAATSGATVPAGTVADREVKPDPDASCRASLEDIAEGDKVSVIQHWSVRPGHLTAALSAIKAISGQEEVKDLQYISFGTSDLLVQYRDKIPTRQAIEQFVKWFRESSGDLVSSNTIIALSKDQTRLDPGAQDDGPRTSPIISHFLVKMVVTPAEIGKLSKGLSAIGFPKIETTRVLNLLSNCNDCVADPLSFSDFLALLPFISRFTATCANLTMVKSILENTEFKKDPSRPQWLVDHYMKPEPGLVGFTREEALACADDTWDLCHRISQEGWQKPWEILKHYTRALEMAYRSRFRSGYGLVENTDFAISIKGGLQFLVSATDGAFKALVAPFSREAEVFVAVGSNSEVTVLGNSAMELDPFSLLSPENAAVVITHEAAHCFYSEALEQMQYTDEDVGEHPLPLRPLVERMRQRSNRRRGGAVSRVADRDAWPMDEGGRQEPPEEGGDGRQGPSDRSMDLDDDSYFWSGLEEELFADMVCFLWAYGGDPGLFQRCHWAQFFRMPSVWTWPDKELRHNARSFAFRIQAVLEAFGKLDERWSVFHDFGLKSWRRDSYKIINTQWDETHDMVRRMHHKEPQKHFVQACRRWIEAEFKNLWSVETVEEARSLARAQATADEGLLLAGGIIEFQTETFDPGVSADEDQAEAPAAEDEGQPPGAEATELDAEADDEGSSVERSHEFNAARFVLRLVRAYLQATDIFNRKHAETTVLRRHRETGRPEVDKEHDPYLMVDPRGASFIYDHEHRKIYWRLRNAFLTSLWDLSAKRTYNRTLRRMSSLEEVQDLGLSMQGRVHQSRLPLRLVLDSRLSRFHITGRLPLLTGLEPTFGQSGLRFQGQQGESSVPKRFSFSRSSYRRFHIAPTTLEDPLN